MRAGLLVAIAIILGRLSGLVREILLARTFGKTEAADWAILLLSIPDLIVNLLLGGAIAAVLMPEWVRRNELAGKLLYQKSLITIALCFGGLIVCLWLFRHHVYSMLAPGLGVALEWQGSKGFFLVLLSVPLTALAGVTTAYANFKGRFFLPAMGTFVLNLAIIIGILLSRYANEPLVILSASILAGAVIRWSMQLVDLHFGSKISAQVTPQEDGHWKSTETRILLTRYFQALASAGLLILLPVIGRAYASEFGIGQMALFSYAQKVPDLPIGILSTVLASTLLPKLSQLFATQTASKDAIVAFESTMKLTIAISMAIIIPAIFYASPIMHLLYGSRTFQEADLMIMSNLMAIGLIALPLQGMIVIYTCAYSAMRDYISPLIANVLAILALPIFIHLTGQKYGLLGVSAVIVLSQLIILILLAIALRGKIKVNYMGVFFDADFLKGIFSGIIIFLVMFLVGKKIEAAIWLQVGWAAMSGISMLVCFFIFIPESRRLLAIRNRKQT